MFATRHYEEKIVSRRDSGLRPVFRNSDAFLPSAPFVGCRQKEPSMFHVKHSYVLCVRPSSSAVRPGSYGNEIRNIPKEPLWYSVLRNSNT